jgi:hypothetical protein
MASNETSKYKLSVVEGTELQLSLSGPAGPAGPAGAAGPNTVTTSTTTNLTGYIFGNGTNIAGATAAASGATADTLVLRDSLGAASFATSAVASGAAITGTNSSSGIGVRGSSGSGIGVYGESTSSDGVSGVSSSNDGGKFSSTGGNGSRSYSIEGTGAVSESISGALHHSFGDSGNNRSAVERIRGWFVWFFGSFTGRLKTADITANREWTLPDESGTIALARNTGKTIYVDTNGTDTRGSLSQYSISVPFATIGAAMAASVIGDTVRVRAGNYTITQTINLNGEGNLHLEEGAVVTCSVSSGTVSGPVFSLSANESKSISGGGQFIITGNTMAFWLQFGGGLQTQLCSVECATISTTTSPLNAARIFDVSTGVLVVNAETVYALASTIIRCEGTSSNLHYAVKFTYCSRFAHFPTSGSLAQMSCDCWTIACNGTKCFEIVGGTVAAKYESLFDNSPTGCTFFSLEYGNNSTANSLVIRGGRAMTYSNNPCIRFTTTTGTNKIVRLIGDPFFYTNGGNSITADSARSVLCSFASSNKGVNTSFVTIVGGTYAVNAGFTQ